VAKRTFDLLAAGVGLLLLSPLFVVVALAITLDSQGPVFFRQARVGRGGRTFRIVKFRTMRERAEEAGGQLTVAGDPRVTRVGALLRKSKLDELPQLFNVVAGDMSLVGPRPEVPRYVAHYDARQRRVLDVRPGITDPASIAYRDENDLLDASTDPEAVYLEQIMPAKLEMNLAYLQRRSLAGDIAIIFRTFGRILRRGG
jgi:lipopolysaccharide/colanic/teichoic acid biosynthesis glycosyltransferase